MKKIIFLIIGLMFLGNAIYSQCSITTNTNASALTCGTAPLSGCGGIVYIGNGTNAMTLSMNANLNLTCLGAIRFIVRNNATLDFAPFNGANFDLLLGAGSTIEFELGSNLNGGNSGSCSNSDRITIGGVVVATCQGGGAPLSFGELVSSGGYGPFTVVANPSSGCGPLASTMTVTPGFFESGVTVTSVNWYSAASGGTLLSSDTSSPYSYSVSGLISTTTYYVEMVTSAYTSVRRPVTITVNPDNTASTASLTPTVCINTAISAITHTTAGATGIGASTNLPAGVTASWASNTITISGTPTVSGTFNYSIPLTGGCGTVNATGTITVNANNTVGPASSSPTVCMNSTIPAVTHTTTGATGIGAPTNLPAGVTASWASNTISISGTPTTSGTFIYSIPLTGGCGSVNATGTITVNVNNTVGPASSSPTVCMNSAIPVVTHATTGATGIGAPTNLPAGVTASWASNTISISGTPTASGTFIYSIPLTGGCGSVNATGTINVNPLPSTPIVGTITQPTCISTTGSVVLSGLPASGTWTINPGGVSGTGTSTTLTGLAVGTYNFTVTNSNGCVSLATSNVVLNTVLTNTWNGSTWSLGSPPTITQRVVIAGNYNANSGNFSSCSLQINPGVTITVNANQYIEVDNAIVNDGTFFIDDDGSLIQNNNASVNSGSGINTIVRKPDNLKLYDYVDWSSPQNNTSFTTIPNSRYYEWNPTAINTSGVAGATGNWVKPSGTAMVPGKGYTFRVPTNLNQNVSFSGGQFNNGVINVSISKGTFTSSTPIVGTNGTVVTRLDDNWNFIGNPYPSAIDAIDFLNDNAAVLENGQVSIWRHITGISQIYSSPFYATFGYNYNNNDYVYFNGTGSVPSGAFDGKIASGQGFYVVMKDDVGTSSPSTVVFKNSQRNKSYNNSQFFRTSLNSKVNSVKHRIWVDIVNSNKIGAGMLIGYVDGATNEDDFSYDSKTDLNSGFHFYSILNSTAYKIQGRQYPFDVNDQIPLGFMVPLDGKYIVNISGVDGVFLTGQKIYLEDKKMGSIHDLTQSPYEFTTLKGTFNNRFVLRYTNGSNISVSKENQVNTMRLLNNNGGIQLISDELNIDSLEIFNVLGQSMFKANNINSKVFNIKDSDLKQNVLIFRGKYSDGTEFVKKTLDF